MVAWTTALQLFWGTLMTSVLGMMISLEELAGKRNSATQKIRELIILVTRKMRIEISDVDSITVEIWVDSVHVRYITMTKLSVR